MLPAGPRGVFDGIPAFPSTAYLVRTENIRIGQVVDVCKTTAASGCRRHSAAGTK